MAKGNWIDGFTRAFFWFGFCVFLLASIPHIAAYFRHFDPNAMGTEDIFYWTIGYLLAIVIDVTDVLVSIAVMKNMSKGVRWQALIGYWMFIVFVMALSWLINWQYNIVFGTNTFATADRQSIFGVSIGSINPIIGSAFQLLLLVYTAMAHSFSTKPVEKSAAQLKAEADEAEEKAKQLARLRAVNKGQNDSKVAALFDSLSKAKEQAKGLINGGNMELNTEVKPEVDNDQKGLTAVPLSEADPGARSSKNEGKEEPETEVKPEVCEPNSGEIAALSDDILAVLKTYPKIEPLLSKGRSTASLAEVAEVTGFGVKLLANRIEKGELKHPWRNKERIVITSLLQWLKTAKPRRPNDRQTDKIVALKTLT